jgi:hypothetical protein
MDLKDQIATFCLMFIWDIVPAVLVILMFWHIPAPHQPKGRSSERHDLFPEVTKENSQEFIL